MERWKINLYTVWFSQILSIMSFSFGIPFIPFYIQELGIIEPDKIKIYAGVLSMAPAVTMAVMAPIWGMAADRWGKKLMLLRAMLCASFIIAGMGIVAHVNQLIILRLIQGVFTGTVTASAALVASSTPSNRLSFSLGFLSSSTFIGASAGPVIGGFLAEYAGYRGSFLIGGALMLIDFILVLSLVKEENPSCPLPVNTKGQGNAHVSIFTSLIIVMLFLLFVLRFSRAVFNPYLPLFVQESLSGQEGAVRITGIINGVTGLMTALSGLTVSRLGDRYDKMVLLKILLAAGILFSIPLVFSSSLWVFTIVYSIFFFVIGGVEPVVVSISTEHTTPERRGMLFGIQGLAGNVGWILSPMLGSLISLKFSLQAILVLIPITLVPGLLSVFFIKKGKGITVDGTGTGGNTDINCT